MTLGSALFRLSSKSSERLLLQWFRTGERPDFTRWKGVKMLGGAPDLTKWTMADVERFMIDTLKQDRSPATEDGSAPADSMPVSEAIGSHGRYRTRTMAKGSLLELVDLATGEIVASGLTTAAAERMVEKLET